MTERIANRQRSSIPDDSSGFEESRKRLYHGTRAALSPGHLVPRGDPGGVSGGTDGSAFTYLSPNLDAAIWSAELAEGDGSPRVYIVEADGPIEDASGILVAPGHPYMSWRTRGQVRVTSEVVEWTWYHGTRAELKSGDLLHPGSNPNHGQTLSHVYLARTLDAAIWGAELALGDGPQRIYIVEPTGSIEDDPNVTNKRFRGNPTKSYRSRDPLRVIGELTEWEGHAEEAVAAMKAGVEDLAKRGLGPIDN